MATPPTEYIMGDGLVARRVPPKGLGVFATKFFPKNSVVARCPVLVMRGEYDALEKCSLTDYYYNWEEPGKDGAVAWGCGSLMNHSYDANIQYVKHFDTHDISYVAWRDIHPGDELTMNYNGTTPDDKTPLSKKGYTWDAL